MCTRLVIGLLWGVWLTACQAVGPTPTMTPTLTVAPTLNPPPTLKPQPVVSPTATLLVQGLIVRLGTPDVSPDCPDHYPWFFDNPAHECASIVLNTWGTVQHFEHGLMVWFQEGGRTYVLLDDGSPFKPYQEVADHGTYQPAPGPAVQPPPGFYEPILGFAKFWRGLIPGYEWIRERLGWATAPEVSYSMLWQCNTATGDAARCYFTGPQDEIIVMTLGSAKYWNYRHGPAR